MNLFDNNPESSSEIEVEKKDKKTFLKKPVEFSIKTVLNTCKPQKNLDEKSAKISTKRILKFTLTLKNNTQSTSEREKEIYTAIEFRKNNKVSSMIKINVDDIEKLVGKTMRIKKGAIYDEKFKVFLITKNTCSISTTMPKTEEIDEDELNDFLKTINLEGV